MSISYYALPTRDRQAIGPTLEGKDTSRPIDEKAVRARLKARGLLVGGDAETLKWEAGNDYIFVDIHATHVEVTHNAGRGSGQIEVLMSVLERLQGCGLHVYDPQQGDWYPG